MQVNWKNTDYLINGLLGGDRIVLARALTLVESRNASDRKIAAELLRRLSDLPTITYKRIAISGAPGAGKSTFIEQFGTRLADQDKGVAVLAIDPSSQISKGSILGDKTRMETLSRHPKAFIRPSSAGEILGGVAANTYASTLLCAAAGYEYILIETVGVGQSEVAARHLSDFFMLVLLPGGGDELQGIKRGIMESADLLFVNKADGDQINQAKTTAADYRNAIHLFPSRSDSWQIPVLCGSALENTGIDQVQIQIEHFFEKNEEFISNTRKQQGRYWFNELLFDRIKYFIRENGDLNQIRSELLGDLESGKITPFEASDQLFEKLTQTWRHISLK